MMTAIQNTYEIRSFLDQYEGLHFCRLEKKTLDYRNISIDTRTLKPDELYISIRGENHDGHSFAEQALNKGASAVVVEKEWYESDKIILQLAGKPVIVVQDTLDFLQRLGAWHRRRFSFPVIVVTGSNGKTTTREMIAAILSAKFNVFRSEGNKNNHIGLPLMLLKMTENDEIAVLEIGTNHPGEIAHLSNLAQPTSALITNIGKGHLGFFGTLEEVYREKTALFDAASPESPVFINMEDPFLRQYPTAGRISISSGFSESFDVWGDYLSIDKLGCVKFRLNGAVDIQLHIPGEHNFINALLAAAIGLYYRVSEASIKNALEQFAPASQRMEMLEKEGVLWINDAYNANPNSMCAAVDHLSRLSRATGKRILVLGDMLELGDFAESEHFDLGTYIAAKPIDMVFLYGPESKAVRNGIQSIENTKVQAFWYDSHKKIAEHLRQALKKNDAVLLKGSRGMKMETVLEQLL